MKICLVPGNGGSEERPQQVAAIDQYNSFILQSTFALYVLAKSVTLKVRETVSIAVST